MSLTWRSTGTFPLSADAERGTTPQANNGDQENMIKKPI